MIPHINIKDFTYDLPDERIAKYPLEQRDMSKLLVYKDGTVSESCFRNLPSFIPEGSIMVFNDTKVVPARLYFQKATGAVIEVFCLKPCEPRDYNLNFASTSSCSWECIVGNARKWKGNELLSLCNPENNPDIAAISLKAELVLKEGRTNIVRFSWESGESFSKILEICGSIPIPPYLNRDTEAIDLVRYQTTYAFHKGSVAAPTAGLHFTDAVMDELRSRGVDIEKVCLHVGAGTFLPVKDEDVARHTMHNEPMYIQLQTLKRLAELLRHEDRKVIAVGTTSVRTLESLYYVGVHVLETGEPTEVTQWEPYEEEKNYSAPEAIDAIARYMEERSLSAMTIGTQIIIVPGFKFRIVDMLVTNFHQPQSTLLLLISAFTGGEKWKDIYSYAMQNGFRFLSYGDSSLLCR